jgi:Dolichyl-phosphate-mannose-protein mannosyltransferase
MPPAIFPLRLIARPVWRRAVWGAYIILLLSISVFRIVDTYPVLSHTNDEPAHLAAGMELLDRGKYTYEQQHPPLARIAAAFGPYLLGARSQGEGDIFGEGLAILYASTDYERILSAARLGTLPFFLLLVAVTSIWAWLEFGAVHAAISALLLVSLPTILAHAGLATTDLPLTAGVTAALFAFVMWLERPNGWRGAAFGASVALAITAKFSALVFLPACFLSIVALRWWCERGRWTPRQLAAQNPVGLLTGVVGFGLIVWAVYGCPADLLQPYRNLWAGIQEVAQHNAAGHPSFFWGEVRDDGWWLFFPVALLLKTPLPFLLLSGYGTIVLLREHRHEWRHLVPLVSAAAILLVAMSSHLNLGVRYVLPFYPLMALVAGFGAVRLLAWRSLAVRAVLAVLLIGQIVASADAHPDYLPYFNVFAGRTPERLLVDSDMDWGQDVNRVAAELRARDISQVAAAIQGNADLSRHGFPPYTYLDHNQPTTGWIVISATQFAFGTGAPPFDGYRWLEAFEPVAMIGKTVRLYHVEPLGAPVAIGAK